MPYINMKQSKAYICPSLLNLLLISHLISPLQVVTEHRLSSLCHRVKFPLPIHFSYSNVYISTLLSQFVQPSPSPAVSTSLFSMSAFLLLLYKQFHQYNFSRFHIHALIYDICFSLTYFALYSRIQFIRLTKTDSDLFLFMANIPCIYVSYLLYLFICQWTSCCFHVLAIVNSAAMNSGVHMSFRIVIFLGYMPSSGTDGSYDSFGLSRWHQW